MTAKVAEQAQDRQPDQEHGHQQAGHHTRLHVIAFDLIRPDPTVTRRTSTPREWDDLGRPRVTLAVSDPEAESVGNERLRAAMVKAHVDAETVSQQTGVDLKTVQRWLGGRIPYARHRWAVSRLLDEDETYLWPETTSTTRALEASRSELVNLYPYRSALPTGLWWELFNRAQAQIDVLVYAALFLHEQHPDLSDLLRSKAAAGCRIRVTLGDPESDQVRLRGIEEQFGHGIESRCRLALMHYRPLLDVTGIEINVHQTMLYSSIYRFDDELLANTHVWGVSAYLAPVLHLRRLPGGSLFDTYAQSFDAVWATSRPVSLERLEGA
jgi:hypothetical protein